MKSRLAKKIGRQTFRFSNWDTNYQPYSINQQKKAIKIVCRKCRKELKESLLNYGVYSKCAKKSFSPFRTVW